MLAEEWYKKFYSGFYNDSQILTVADSKNLTDEAWTRGMDGFLKRLAGSLGYKVAPESRVIGQQRIDHRWAKPGSTVVLEHENNYTSISNEIQKLLGADGDLRVLITYLPDLDFVAHALKVADEVASGIKSGRWVEFLLIVGGYEEADWTAF